MESPSNEDNSLIESETDLATTILKEWKKKLILSMIKFLQEDETSQSTHEYVVKAVKSLEKLYSVNYKRDYTEVKHVDSILNMFIANSTSSRVSVDNALKAENYKLKGNEFIKKRLYQKAVESYTKAIQLNSKNPIYFCNRGAANSYLNKDMDCVKDCIEALTLDPKYTKAYSRLGASYSNLKLFDEAKKSYEAALYLDSNNIMYKKYLKIAKFQCKNPDINISDMDMDSDNLEPIAENPHFFDKMSCILKSPSICTNESGPSHEAQGGDAFNMDNLVEIAYNLGVQMQDAASIFTDEFCRRLTRNQYTNVSTFKNQQQEPNQEQVGEQPQEQAGNQSQEKDPAQPQCSKKSSKGVYKKSKK